jgi:hypothetical protein
MLAMVIDDDEARLAQFAKKYDATEDVLMLTRSIDSALLALKSLHRVDVLHLATDMFDAELVCDAICEMAPTRQPARVQVHGEIPAASRVFVQQLQGYGVEAS